MKYKVKIYGVDGGVVGEREMIDLFNEGMINQDLIHEYYLLQMSNRRIPIAHTKTRGEVSGSNKKIYRQKGTGYARAGEKRSPIRVGGGVAFGPRNERNYKKDMPKKMRKRAMIGLISMVLQEDRMKGLRIEDDLKKTKDFVDLLNKIGLEDKKLLVVLPNEFDLLKKVVRNVEKVKYVVDSYLNPVDLLTHPEILVVEKSLDYINSLNID